MYRTIWINRKKFLSRKFQRYFREHVNFRPRRNFQPRVWYHRPSWNCASCWHCGMIPYFSPVNLSFFKH